MRSTLYRAARILGDLNAIKRGRMPQRLARRMVYRQTGKAARWFCRMLGVGR